MKKAILNFACWLLTLFSVTNSSAQGMPTTTGGEATGSGGTVSYSVGEMAFNSYSTSGGIIIEGVQQAYTSSNLPITLLEFKGKVNNQNQVVFSWTTVAEYNNSFFTIESSIDGKNFKKVLSINSLGNSNNAQEYTATDINPYSGISYYRLTQTDFSGNTTNSNIVTINLLTANEALLSVFPNPTTSILNLEVKDFSSKSLNLSLSSIDGKQISNQKINSNITTINTTSLSNGMYLLQVFNGNTVVKSFRIIKK